MDFAVPADYRMKIEESKKIDKQLDFARKLKKKPRNMKVTVISMGVRALGTVPKGLEKRLVEQVIRIRIETTQITALSRSA